MIGTRRGCKRAGIALFLICLVLLLGSVDRRLLLLAGNTLWLSLGACLVSLPGGTFLAFVVTRTDLPLRRVVWGIVIALLCLPLYLQATAWEAGLGKLGWLSLTYASAASPLLSGWLAAIWIQGIWSTAWVTLIVAVAFRASEPEMEESALLDASQWEVFWRVTFRRGAPGMVLAAIWVALTTATEMTVSDLYQIRTLSEELYVGFALTAAEDGAFGTRQAILITLLLTGIAMVALDAIDVMVGNTSARPAYRFRLGRWRWPCVGCVALLVMLMAGVPLGSLLYQAGLVIDRVGEQTTRYWSLPRLTELLIPWPGTYRSSALWQFLPQFRWSLLVGVLAATLSTMVAGALAWWGRDGGWRSVPAAFVAALGLATMGPLIGLTLVWFFTVGDVSWLAWCYQRSIAAPLLAATWRALPLPILVLWVALRSLGRDTIESSSLDGAGPLRRFFYIGLGQRRSAVVVAWLLALVIATGELSATVLATPPGLETVPIRVFSLIHAGVSNQVAAVCLTSVGGFVAIALVLTRARPVRWLWNGTR